MHPVQTIAVFGDSITYGAWDPQGGWVQRLRTMLEENRQPPWERPFVYNLGVPGETTVELLARFPAEYDTRISADETSGIIIATGLNDALYLSDVRHQHTPLPQFTTTLRSLFELAKAKTSFVLCVGLTRVIESQTQPIPWRINKHYHNETIAEYDATIGEVARSAGVQYLPLRDTPWDTTLLEEGLHPNAAGHEGIANAVYGVVASWV